VHLIHHTFSLAELLTLSSFHLTSSTITFSLNAAEETVRVIDGLFGSTETSRALAAIVEIVKRELYIQEDGDDDLSFFHSPSKLGVLGGVAKAMTAFACLQFLTWRRKCSNLLVTQIAECTVDYDKLRRRKTENDNILGCNPLEMEDEQSQSGIYHVENLKFRSRDIHIPINFKTSLFDNIVPAECILSGDVCASPIIALAEGESDSDFNVSAEDIRVLLTIAEIPRDGHGKCSSFCPQPSIQLFPQDFYHTSDSAKKSLLGHRNTSASKLREKESCAPAIDPRSSLPRTRSIPMRFEISKKRTLIANFSRFLRFSTGAYGKRFLRLFGLGDSPPPIVSGGVDHANHYVFAAHTGITVQDIILSSYQAPRPGYLSKAEVDDASNHNFFRAQSVLGLEAPRIHPLVHYLCVDKITKNIILSLRGTLGLSDVLTDLTCDYADLDVWITSGDGNSKKKKRVYHAHAGMMKSAELLANQIGPFVKHALEENPEHGLILCGHSLGGGVAALLSILWSDKFNDELDTMGDSAGHFTAISSGLPCGRPLHSFTFGSPCVVSKELALHCSNLISTVMHGSDFVPCLSLGFIKDLKLIARTLSDYRNKGVSEKVISKALGFDRCSPPVSSADDGTSTADLDEDWLWSLIQTLRAEMVSDKLYPPGTVYWLRTKAHKMHLNCRNVEGSLAEPRETGYRKSLENLGKGPSSCASRRYFVALDRIEDVHQLVGEMHFSRSMITDHNPRFYEEGIRALDLGLRAEFDHEK
jgi:hypothetical protein